MPGNHMVEIISQEETDNAWRFTAQILADDGALIRTTVTLAWADYNHWSVSGADEPAAVALAVVRFMLMHVSPDGMPETFDASAARRRYPDADATIPQLIAS